MLTTHIHICLLDDRIDHLNGVVLVDYQPLDVARDNGAFPRHQALSSPMTWRWRRLLLLIPTVNPNKWARWLLGWMVILRVALFLLGATLEATLGADVDNSPCCLRVVVDILTIALCLTESVSERSNGKN